VNDPSNQFPATPLEAKMQVDALKSVDITDTNRSSVRARGCRRV